MHLRDTDGYADRHWVLGEGNIPCTPKRRAPGGRFLAGCDSMAVYNI
ncbi:hypothetical protein AIOL_004026 [Candidatus Rhodobacter oscarellae]|uniref:Uncharacterized protein n=1 Tax=Candidatus Rhodobacter oscarellae TaxID=1675527 RepID=A0A0J9E8G7_9RHOB|nr:hypothetical protein AIOL_004026 [Candidatus Rhodobacter lobularis]